MRVVLDTNVVVSAALSQHSVPAMIHNAWLDGLYELIVSAPLLAEYRAALSYDRVRSIHKKSDREIETIVQRYTVGATIVEPVAELTVITADPDDNRILECAIAGTATHIVSGDRHLLGIREFQNIAIVAPREFLTELHRGIAGHETC